MAKESYRGFVPAVLSQSMRFKAFVYREELNNVNGRFARIFLLSRKPHIPKSKPKATENRKYISNSEQIFFGGVEYKVNSRPTGIYSEMLLRVLKELELAQQLWGRVLVVRVDLHQARYTEDSEQVSWFFKQMVRKLKRKYRLSQVGYFWVREHERAKAQHYHCWFFLDGNKIKHSSKLIQLAKDTWVKNWAGNHHIPTTKKPFRLIDSEEVKHEVVFWLSYGGKGRGKGYRPPQSKDYSTSRLKAQKE
ncbi:MAG: inovirus-type Gp2 protein [Pseudomonadota bacterium]|nr:inovirus-type Gp2 protein [Pseudomonadota bacterium]